MIPLRVDDLRYTLDRDGEPAAIEQLDLLLLEMEGDAARFPLLFHFLVTGAASFRGPEGAWPERFLIHLTERLRLDDPSLEHGPYAAGALELDPSREPGLLAAGRSEGASPAGAGAARSRLAIST